MKDNLTLMMCVVFVQFQMGKIGTLPLVQSAYRRNYSTETALTKVVSYFIMAADVTLLALLDLRATFATVDHDILLQHLQTTHHGSGATFTADISLYYL